jgi:alginate O-acetyltransferase complex protein AlgI
MWALSFSIFAGLKWMTWWKARARVAHRAGRSLAYLVAWPGMDAEAFLDEDMHPVKPIAQEWIWAVLKTALGVALLWIVARRIPEEQNLLRGWIGLFGLIFLLHFGSFHLIALFWQAIGIAADPIMSKPLLSKSLSEFWGKRWNLGFRQLAHDLIFRPLHKRTGVAAAGLVVFVASGLIHDLVISLPARGGYGLPTGYFLLQGLGVTLERSALGRRLRLQKGGMAWMFMFVVAAGPAFWLFHPPFVLRVIIPFMHAIHAL